MVGLRILVVDDEENFLNLVSKILRREGYEVKTAANGSQILERIHEGPYDLALVDIRMHSMDGLSVLDRIKEHAPRTPVIMITAYPNDVSRRLAFCGGAADYLSKPIDINELKDAVRRHIGHKGFSATS